MVPRKKLITLRKMDDIMILMHKIIVDIQGFNDSQFGIFDEHEHEQLLYLWNSIALNNPNKFISFLSPEQKHRVGIWAVERTSYSIDELISSLEKFTKFLKKSSKVTYPKKKNFV